MMVHRVRPDHGGGDKKDDDEDKVLADPGLVRRGGEVMVCVVCLWRGRWCLRYSSVAASGKGCCMHRY